MVRTPEEQIRKELLKLVSEKQGCKATELAVEAAKSLAKDPGNAYYFDELDQVPTIIDQLIQEGEILEVEFVLPTMTWRCKSFLLPKGTEIRLSQGAVVQFSSTRSDNDEEQI